MDDSGSRPDLRKSLSTIALVGNYPPRECGIATFSYDLLKSLQSHTSIGECYSVAMNNTPQGYNYPSDVRFVINEQRVSEYLLAASVLNMNRTGAVSLQHEYGIYGGESGCMILDLLDQLNMPVMTTLHTVLKEPSESQLVVMQRIAELSDCLVVMSDLSREFLCEIYGVSEARIVTIPHGIPDLAFVDPAYYKDQFNVEGRKVILTFGLLSPSKGIEYVIDAMPEIVRDFPDAVYIVLGKTHPNVLRDHDESYRVSLQQRVRELNLENHVIFHNEFVSLDRLTEFLGCADVYVTPYLNEAQAVSGTLAYALGAGKAVVSTPYWYAQEMLAGGRGMLVPFRSADAIAGAICAIFRSPVETTAMRKRAYSYTRNMTWPNVANEYARVFSELSENRLRTFYSAVVPAARAVGVELPALKLDHLRRLTDSTGILQHARFTVPWKDHGYTTDDNSRALIAAAMGARYGPLGVKTDDLITTYLSFLDLAFNENTRRFRNLLRYQRTWIDDRGSDDSHGRALMALGAVIDLAKDDGHIGVALELFDRALPAAVDAGSPRAWATSLLGIHSFRRRFPGARTTREVRNALSQRLMGSLSGNSTSDWMWLENRLTYDNATIPHALIVTGADTDDEPMVEAGLRVLEWLYGVQSDGDVFVPIGNQGWYERNGPRARYDQQPLEAEGMVTSCMAAYDLTGLPVWEERAISGMDWFLGRNDARTPMYDYASGGCHDGLQAKGVNQNEGAESTVAWLTAVLGMMRHHEKAVRRSVPAMSVEAGRDA